MADDKKIMLKITQHAKICDRDFAMVSPLFISRKKIIFVWASSQVKQILLHVNNKGADQPVHLHSLVSTFVFYSLECVIAYLAT